MPVVRMPDGTLVNMPDNPTPEQLAALEGITAKQDTPNLDGGKSLVSGAVDAASNFLQMITGTMEKTAEALADPQYEAGLRMGVPKTQAEIDQRNRQPNAGETSLLTDFVERNTPDIANYKPQSTTGKYLRSIGEQVPFVWAGPGSAGLKSLLAIGGGVGAEAGGQATDDSAIGRFLGGLVGGGAAPVAATVYKNSDAILAEAVKALKHKDFKEASQLARYLDDMGIPYLNSQLFRVPTTLPAITQAVSSHPEIGPVVMQHMKDVPEATRAAIDTRMVKIAPTGGKQDALDAAQEAAKSRIDAVKGEGQAAYTNALPGRFTYEEQRIKNLYDDLNDMALDVGMTTNAGKIIARKAAQLKDTEGHWVTDSNAVSQIYKELNEDFPDLGSLDSVAASKMRTIFKENTPEFDAARSAFSEHKTEIENPLKKSLTGQVAEAGGGVQPDKITANQRIMTLVFPKDAAQPDRIRKLAQDFRNAGDNEALAGVTREYITRAMETHLAPGSSSKFKFNAPGELANSIYGTNAQRVNLEAAIGEVAKDQGLKPSLVVKGFKNFFDALETYKDVRLTGGVNSGELALEAGKTKAGGALSPFFTARRAVENLVMRKAYGEIADVMISPDGLKKLEELSKFSPYSDSANMLIMDIVTSINQGAAATAGDTQPTN
jgi:hypothetical protein